MNDPQIRQALLQHLQREYGNDPDTVIIQELGLCQGDARVDIAVVNGSIQGFEIKSDQDTLKRLPLQIGIYCRSLHSVTLVVGNRHLTDALNLIPNWWGVIIAQEKSGQPLLRTKRKGKPNPSIDPAAMVQLLWRDEAYNVLKQLGLHHGIKSKPKAVLWNRLIDSLSAEGLTTVIGSKLKSRENWRSLC